FAEAVKVPALCAWKNPSDMPTEVAAIQEPFGNAVYSCETAEVRSKSVVIFGDGPIASFATGIAKAWGAREVVVVGLNTARLGIAEKMGADRTLDARDGEVVERLRDHTDGEGFEVVLEMAGVEIAIQQGLSALAKGGTFVAFGIPSGNVSIDYTDALVFKEAKVLGVNGRRMFSTWYQTQTLLMTGQVDVGPVLTHSFGLGEFERAFGLLEDPASEAGKVILKP
ncbi:MAG: zinc-binding dehydrogenase, partial [Acidobacteriota bacterium]